MKDVAALISSVLSHPSTQGKTSEEIGTDIANVLHNHRVLASSVTPLELMVSVSEITQIVQDYDCFLYEELGVNEEKRQEILSLLDTDPSVVDDAIASVEPDFNFDNSVLEEEVSAEVYQAHQDILRHIIENM